MSEPTPAAPTDLRDGRLGAMQCELALQRLARVKSNRTVLPNTTRLW